MYWLFLLAYIFANWQGPNLEGELDSKLLNEASGLEKIANHWYQVNDSGDGPYVYVSDKINSSPRKVKVQGYTPLDLETLTQSQCGLEVCLVVGDVGDNFRFRDRVQFYFIKVPNLIRADSALLFHKLEVKYPDGSHNAEGAAVDENGDLIIINKIDHDAGNVAANVYRLKKDKLMSKNLEHLEIIDSLPIYEWVHRHDKYSQLVTGLDIDKDGNWYILTYHAIIVLRKSSGKMQNWPREIIPIDPKILKQAEAIKYDADAKKIYVTTELRQVTNQPIYSWSYKDKKD